MQDNIRFCTCLTRYIVDTTIFIKETSIQGVKRYKRCKNCGKKIQTLEILITND